MSQASALAFSSACLPDQLQSELYLARCGRRGGEDARRRNWGSVGAKQAGIVGRYHRRRKIRVIQYVEELSSELRMKLL